MNNIIHTEEKENGSLAGHILIATPNVQDDIFSESSILICSHDEKGAVGIILNRPLESVNFDELLNHLKIDSKTAFEDRKLYFGGPVEVNRGFVLHSNDYQTDYSITVNADVSITSNLTLFEELSKGTGPKDILVALGYAGWSAGQLEEEIQNNGWLTLPATHDLIFTADPQMKWQKALDILGINPTFLDPKTGTA